MHESVFLKAEEKQLGRLLEVRRPSQQLKSQERNEYVLHLNLKRIF